MVHRSHNSVRRENKKAMTQNALGSVGTACGALISKTYTQA